MHLRNGFLGMCCLSVSGGLVASAVYLMPGIVHPIVNELARPNNLEEIVSCAGFSAMGIGLEAGIVGCAVWYGHKGIGLVFDLYRGD